MWDEARRLITGSTADPDVGRSAWILVILFAVQLLAQGHWYAREAPTRADYQRAERFMEFVDGLEGTYYMPGHVLPRDNTFWIHEMTWRDLGKVAWGAPIAKRLAKEMRRKKIDTIILEKGRAAPRQLRPMVKEYKLDKELKRTIPLRMMAATPSAPGEVYKRR